MLLERRFSDMVATTAECSLKYAGGRVTERRRFRWDKKLVEDELGLYTFPTNGEGSRKR